MKKTTLFTALVSMIAINATAQNVWDGSSISTVSTNGKLSIGTNTPVTGTIATFKSLSTNTPNGINLNLQNATSGSQVGINNISWFVNPDNTYGSSLKCGISNSVAVGTNSDCFGINSALQSSAGTGLRIGIASTVSFTGGTSIRCGIYGNVIDGNLFGIGTKPKETRAGFFVGAAEIIASTDAEKIFIINRRNIGGANGTDVFRIYGNGKMYATEIFVKLSSQFPDYVFAPDYQLMPIYDLKNYITENKHLPNIPPANEVENEGLNVGEMNTKLVEKVEELTLYIIQQQEQIDALKKELETIKH